MKICVSGWYFERDLFEVFKLNNHFEICVVTYYNRANGSIKKDYDKMPVPQMIETYVKESGVKHYKIPVAGLEFGGYDYYLKNIWDHKSPVLFMHDDIVIYKPDVFDRMQQMLSSYDQAFIFRDEVEEIANGRIHGRGIYCSQRFLQYMLERVCCCNHAFDHEHPHYEGFKPAVVLEGTGPHTGFRYDPYNLGEHTEGKPPKHCRHYNEGIYHFAQFAGRTSYTNDGWPGFPKDKVRARVHVPDFNSGRRGVWRGKVYGRGEELNEADNLPASKGHVEIQVAVSKTE